MHLLASSVKSQSRKGAMTPAYTKRLAGLIPYLLSSNVLSRGVTPSLDLRTNCEVHDAGPYSDGRRRARRLHTVDTESKVKLIPRKYFFAFADINWTDDLSHSCPHRYFTPNYTFAFAFVILKAIIRKSYCFASALISVSMVGQKVPLVQFEALL